MLQADRWLRAMCDSFLLQLHQIRSDVLTDEAKSEVALIQNGLRRGNALEPRGAPGGVIVIDAMPTYPSNQALHRHKKQLHIQCNADRSARVWKYNCQLSVATCSIQSVFKYDPTKCVLTFCVESKTKIEKSVETVACRVGWQGVFFGTKNGY